MSYCARKKQLSSSLVYHVVDRGNKREPVFNRSEDYLYFIALLKGYIFRFGLKVYHWALMPNHYHLLLELAKPEFVSKCMAGLNRAYTYYYHKTYFTSGFLWQGRFKLQPVEQEKYLLACGRYIERNPVRANIVQEAQDYPYSSARFYCLGQDDGITATDPTFAIFGHEVAQRHIAYQKFLRSFDSEEEQAFRNLEQPQGSSEFVKRLVMKNGRLVSKKRGYLPKRIVA